MLFYNLPFFVQHPAEIFELWKGGMSFHGGFLGCVAAVMLFCLKNKLPILSLGDITTAVGPIGLFLSTPLTVCLVVLGRHVPQLAFLEVLLGDEPALTPPELLYRQLLMGDPIQATERAEEFLRTAQLASYYDDVAVPALALAEDDRTEGRLSRTGRWRR